MKMLLLGLMLLSSTAFAKEGGNGGDGIKIGGKIYLLDLVEAGVEMEPYFDRGIQIDAKVLARVKKALVVAPVVQEMIAMKLSELNAVSPLSAISLLRAMEAYTFRFVARELVNVADEDTSLQYDADSLVQLAIRRDRIILIDRNTWGQLNPENQAALIFHEMVYAMTPTVDNGRGDEKQPSDLARQVVGYLFHKDFSFKGYKGLYDMSRNAQVIPVSDKMVEEQADGTICASKSVNYVGGINYRRELFIDLDAPELMISMAAKDICHKGSYDTLGVVQSSQYDGKPFKFEITTSYFCKRIMTFSFQDYHQNLGEGGSSNVVVKSRYKLNSNDYDQGKQAVAARENKFDAGLVASSVNIGTRRRPKLQWSVDQSACPQIIKNQFETYLK